MEHVLIGTGGTESEPTVEVGRKKTPWTTRLFQYLFITYWVVFGLAIWLYYVGTCVGYDCFVVKFYPPNITPELFITAMDELRTSSPGIVNYSFFSFVALWTVIGFTAFYVGLGNWRSGVSLMLSVVALLVFIVLLVMLVLRDISYLDWSIAIWLTAPMILGAVLIVSYVTVWIRIRLAAPEYARQSRELIGAIGAFGAQLDKLHDNDLLDTDLHRTTLSLKNLGEFGTFQDRKNEIRERVDTWIASPILMAKRPPTETEVVDSAAALGCLADSIIVLVNSSYKNVKKVPIIMKMIDDLTKSTVMELTFIANKYRTSLRNSLAELGTSVEELGKDHEQGSAFAGTTILSNSDLLPVEARDVLLRTESEAWSKFS